MVRQRPRYLGHMMHRRLTPWVAGAGFALCMASGFMGGCGTEAENTDAVATSDVSPNTYIGPEACGSCHQKEYDDWLASDHFKAMMPATDSTVLGDFMDATLKADGITSSFFKRDDRFFIRTEGSDGALQDFEVKYTFGFDPLQQYLVEAPGGRMQVPRTSWDAKKKVWFHQYAGERIPHGDWLHWTGGAQNWNVMCASCHSTDLRRGFDEASDSYHSTYEHVTVTCESCHGPGGKHASFMAGEEYRSGERVEGSYLHLHKGLDNKALASTCVRCHSRRSEISDEPVASWNVLDNYIPALPTPELYHADGQILDEVYVYGSFAQSTMYRRGVKCTDCHQAHTGKLLFTGDALCRQCHEPEYESREHTFHDSEVGCVSCHMPTRTYMGNDERHDHSIRAPRPDQSVEYGTPNACTQCHTDRTDQWAADAVIRWYGPERPPHYSDRLLAGGRLDERSLNALLELYADTATPDIIRATAVHYMSAIVEERSLDAMLRALKDPDAQVRHQAVHGLVNFPSELWVKFVTPLLKDPIRAVRMEAASVLSAQPTEVFDRSRVPSFTSAYDELMRYLMLQMDMPAGSLMLADHHARTGDAASAEKYYRKALHLDGKANYARLQLAALYNAQGRNEEALNVLNEAWSVDNGNARIPYQQALLLAEMERPREALSRFEEAERMELENDRLFVNHCILLQQLEQMDAAVRVINAGIDRFPGSADLQAEAAGLMIRLGRTREAAIHFAMLRSLAPNDPRLEALRSHMQNRPM